MVLEGEKLRWEGEGGVEELRGVWLFHLLAQVPEDPSAGCERSQPLLPVFTLDSRWNIHRSMGTILSLGSKVNLLLLGLGIASGGKTSACSSHTALQRDDPPSGVFWTHVGFFPLRNAIGFEL